MKPEREMPAAKAPFGSKAWLAAHKTELLLGGGGAVAGIAWWRSHHQSAASSTSSPATVAAAAAAPVSGYSYEPAGTPDPASYGYSYGQGASDLLSIEDELTQLASQVQELEAQPVNKPPNPPPKPPPPKKKPPVPPPKKPPPKGKAS